MKDIKIIYDGSYDKETDEKIHEAMENIGGKFWASGFNYENGERDICFEFEKGNK